MYEKECGNEIVGWGLMSGNQTLTRC